MIAYNAVNGSANSQNSYLINGILKDELGFQGFVVSYALVEDTYASHQLISNLDH